MTIQRGVVSPAVGQLQKDLNVLNIVSPALVVDNDFGPRTDEAVRSFQAAAGLVVDGVVGPNTQGAITNSVTNLVIWKQKWSGPKLSQFGPLSSGGDGGGGGGNANPGQDTVLSTPSTEAGIPMLPMLAALGVGLLWWKYGRK